MSSSSSEEELAPVAASSTTLTKKRKKMMKKSSSKSKSKKKKKGEESEGGFIDDAAILSGSEDEDEEDDDEDGDNNDYERDGFVVDEDDDDDDDEEDRRARRKARRIRKEALEDSDDDDDDDDDDDSTSKKKKKRDQKKGRIRRMRDLDMLNEDDLDLINEAKGIPTSSNHHHRVKEYVEEEERMMKPSKRKMVVKRETFDEDGMDDFIDDDIGDQDHLREEDRLERRRITGNSSQAEEEGMISAEMLATASDIFGNEYLNFMQDEEEEGLDDLEDHRKKFRERGVGVTLGVDSDEEVVESSSSEEDEGSEDLFEGGATEGKLKRKLERREKRKLALKKKADARKARLRRAFEPVQLVENFCTEKDDDIRRLDAPERFYGMTNTTPKQDEEAEEEALWIMGRIPAITAEFFRTPTHTPTTSMKKEEEDSSMNATEKNQRSILDSIIQALKFLQVEKLEPEFIQRYRADIVTSPAVRQELYRILDEDLEWDRLVSGRTKVESMLATLNSRETAVKQADAQQESLLQLKDDLQTAQDKLDETLMEETNLKNQLSSLPTTTHNSEDDDDELFGKDDDDENKPSNQPESQEKTNLQKHLTTVQELLEERAERVAQLATKYQQAQQEAAAAAAASTEDEDGTKKRKKISLEYLWNVADYQQYVSSLTDYRHVQDLYRYLSLCQEISTSAKKTRRFDRDYYRTCVMEGMRDVCYQFTLAPYRVGLQLEDNLNSSSGFQYSRTLPGEDELSDPRRWRPPTILNKDPHTFASDLIDSGELVLFQTNNNNNNNNNNNTPNSQEDVDLLKGCRYVAAMELAYEPRIRRQLRDLYRAHAVLSTYPTKKGCETMDAFSEYYSCAFLHDKPIKEHFPMEDREAQERKAGLSLEEKRELDEEVSRRERDSCLQYLQILKAQATGHINLHIHLPFDNTNENSSMSNTNSGSGNEKVWYETRDWKNRKEQNLQLLLDELERVYLVHDTNDEQELKWNEERKKILHLALTQFVLPQLEAETKKDLKQAAMETGMEAACQNLKTMAMEGPYRPSHLLGENRFLVPTGDLPIVGVDHCQDATYLSAVSPQGEFMESMAIPQGQKLENKSEALLKFLIQTRPAAVLVGTTGGLSCRLLARKLGDYVQQATERWNNRLIQGQEEEDEDFEDRMQQFRETYETNPYHRDHHDEEDDDTPWKCNVELVDDSLAQLFGRSVRSKKEFPDFSVSQKSSISIARYGKDPLAELTYAWSVASDAGVFGTEMLYLNIHPLQPLLPKTVLLKKYQRVLCEAVANVGVDVNASCTYEHLHGLLSFVPGLGPRKAASLKQTVNRMGGVIASRRELLAKRLLGPVVYNNAVAFLRIRDTDALANQYLHPLDDTRLHPDVYHRNNWAVKIAIDALELGDATTASDNNKNSHDKEDIGISALRNVMRDSQNEVSRLFAATKAEWESSINSPFHSSAWDPRINVPPDSWRDKVEELDLDTFADMIDQSGMGKWLSHLLMIKWEFRLPFEDPRSPMEPLSPDKLFQLLTGETDQSLCPGKEVTGKVFRNGDFGSRIKLEGDVPGFIPLRNLADGHVESAEDIVQIGSVVTCIVTEVKKEHLCVDLSLRKEDFRKLPSSWPRTVKLDTNYDQLAAQRLEAMQAKEREARLEQLNLLFGKTKLQDDGTTQSSNEQSASSKRSARLTRRACAHPAFRNAKHDEVEKELKDSGMIGEALIRPSAKQADALAVHWLVRPSVTKVMEIKEEDKDTDASIGNILKLKNESYSSIDEFLSRYIMSMNDRVEQAIHHRKFLDMEEDDLDTQLQSQKQKTPAGVFYNICWNEQYAGYLSLRFIINTTVRNYPIGISPDGFIWGKQTFSNMDSLLNAFKKNPRGTSSSAPKPPSTNEPSQARASRWGHRPPATTNPPTASTGQGWSTSTSWKSNVNGAGWNSNANPPPPPPPPPLPPPSQGYHPQPPSGPPPSFSYPTQPR